MYGEGNLNLIYASLLLSAVAQRTPKAIKAAKHVANPLRLCAVPWKNTPLAVLHEGLGRRYEEAARCLAAACARYVAKALLLRPCC